MKVIRDGQRVPHALRGGALAIGNFDGVHRGHVAVLDAAADAAGRLAAPFGAVIFEPHPREYFAPHTPLFRLTPLPLKTRLLARLGLDVCYVMRFDDALARMSAAEFAGEVLAGRLQARHVVAGYDFRFGKGREGTPALLAELGGDAGFGVSVVEPVAPEGEGAEAVFSSSAVRRMLEAGDPAGAARMLGHWWAVLGRVEGGDRRGRTIGYPTANIRLPDGQAPRLGIYAVRACLAGEWPDGLRPAVAYFGRRPTFGKTDIVLEVHLFDVDVDLYGEELIVEFVEFIRPDRGFDDVAALTAQMRADESEARAILARMAEEPPIPSLPWLNRVRPPAAVDC